MESISSYTVKVNDFSENEIYSDRGVWHVQTAAEMDIAMAKMKEAQTVFETWNQEQVNDLVKFVVSHVQQYYIALAAFAVAETGLGNVNDKAIKNAYAGSVVANSYLNDRTCDRISYDPVNHVATYASPIGLIAGFVPITNPSATTLYKTILTLKTRNAIIFSPHVACMRASYETACVLAEAVDLAGGPPGLIGCVYQTQPKDQREKLAEPLMQHKLTDIVFMTGGSAMVKKAYRCGKPSLGVGAGNVPVIIDSEADLTAALACISRGKTFDNGVLCMSEEVLLVFEDVYDQVVELMNKPGSAFHLCSDEEEKKAFKVWREANGAVSMKAMGKNAPKIAEAAGISLREGATIIVGKAKDAYDPMNPWLREKMAPGLGLIKVKDEADALAQAQQILSYDGLGHSAIIHTNHHLKQKQPFLDQAARLLPVGRITVNQPGCFGTIGGILNFGVDATMSIGCGSWGGNSTSQNIGPRHLINTKTVAVITEDVRLTRKSVPLMRPTTEKIRAVFECFAVCFELVQSYQCNPPNDAQQRAEEKLCKEIAKEAFSFLSGVKKNGTYETEAEHFPSAEGVINLMGEYSNQTLFKKSVVVSGMERQTMASVVRDLARTTNIPPAYLLAIALRWMIKSDVYGSWTAAANALPWMIRTSAGGLSGKHVTDDQDVLDTIETIVVNCHSFGDALPDVTASRYGLDSPRFKKLTKYQKPQWLDECIKQMPDDKKVDEKAAAQPPMQRMGSILAAIQTGNTENLLANDACVI